MGWRKIFAAFLMLALFSASAEATTIESHRIEIDLKSDGSAHVIANVSYGELTSIDAPYIVFGNSKNFAARDSLGALSCTASPQTYGMYYLCRPNARDKQSYSVVFEFDVFYQVVKTAESYAFSYVHASGEPTKMLDILLLLPEGTGIIKGTAITPYSPDAVVGSTGRRVTLAWQVPSPELRTYAFTANYEQVGQIVQYYGNYSRIIAVIFALAFVFVVLKYKVFNRGAGVRSVMDILKDDERKVMGIILNSEGKCKQKTIVQGTNFSKAKVSRILADLESRGIIKKVRTGRTNRVVIAEKSEKKDISDDKPSQAQDMPAPSMDVAGTSKSFEE